MLHDRIDHDQRPGEALHVAHAIQVLLDLLALAHRAGELPLRDVSAAALDLEGLQFGESLQPLPDRVVVGEHASEPALGNVRLTAAARFRDDRVASLPLGPHEQDTLAVATEPLQEVVRADEAPDGALQVDNVDPVALAVDVRLHARVPDGRQMTELNARVQEFLDRNDGHINLRWHTFPAAPGSGDPGRLPLPASREGDQNRGEYRRL